MSKLAMNEIRAVAVMDTRFRGYDAVFHSSSSGLTRGSIFVEGADV